jgi:hypothetical protein
MGDPPAWGCSRRMGAGTQRAQFRAGLGWREGSGPEDGGWDSGRRGCNCGRLQLERLQRREIRCERGFGVENGWCLLTWRGGGGRLGRGGVAAVVAGGDGGGRAAVVGSSVGRGCDDARERKQNQLNRQQSGDGAARHGFSIDATGLMEESRKDESGLQRSARVFFAGVRLQLVGGCFVQEKWRPRMPLTIQWSVAAVGPMPTPTLISHLGETLRSVTAKICCCWSCRG